MKHFSSLALLIIALPAAGVCQKVTEKEITYEYKRLPLMPLDKSLKNYVSKIEVVYEAENQTLTAEHGRKVQEAEAKHLRDSAQFERKMQEAEVQYQRDLEKYEREKKEMQAQYDKELEEYNKQSVAQKMANKTLLNEGKPVLRTPPMPYKQVPSMPYRQTIPMPNMRRIPDKNVLASNLRLDGFTRNDQNAVVVTAVLHGFEGTEKAVTTNTPIMVNGKMSDRYSTRYTVSYRYPVTLKVEVPGKGVVFNETIPATSEMKTLTNSNSAGNMAALEDKLLAENMTLAGEYLNERFGYSTLSRNTVFYSVEPKKMAYDEFTAAYESAMMGYRKLAEDQMEAVGKLRSGLTEWEKALAESNPKDSKARVNEEITIAAMLNSAEASLFTDDYSKAEGYLFKLESLDLSRKQKKKVEELNLFMKDQKKRSAANK